MDLPTIEKRLEAVLEAARREYRKALRSKAPEGTLAEIAVRGNKAARAYKAQIADHAALAARYQSAR